MTASTNHITNIFKSGENEPTTEQFTKRWIALVNQIEKSKGIITVNR